MRRILFDEDVPRPLRRELPGFDIQTVVEVGWSGIKNGELLRRADGAFEVFLTADRNLRFQQNLTAIRLGIVVLAVGSTKVRDLLPYTPRIIEALQIVEPGQVLVITREGT